MLARCSMKRLRLRCARGLRYLLMKTNVKPIIDDERVDTDVVEAALEDQGYYVAHIAPQGESADRFVLDFARSLGDLYVPPDCDPAAPLIRTAPTRKRHAAPFDRPEPIGWHGDFATHEDRPELS